MDRGSKGKTMPRLPSFLRLDPPFRLELVTDPLEEGLLLAMLFLDAGPRLSVLALDMSLPVLAPSGLFVGWWLL